MLQVTEEARTRIATILSATPTEVFRVGLDGGGCAGFRFLFALGESKDDDIVIENGIVTDPVSAAYLDKAILNFKDEIFSQNFFLESPDITNTCGCGESVGF
jgi:iron-sulfur cluster assembly accessory protein